MSRKLVDYIREAAEYPEELYAQFNAMPGSPTWLLSTRVRRLDAIVEQLRKNAYAPAMKVFGSAAEDDGKIPDSIEVFIDTGSYKLGKQIAMPALGELIQISSKYSGLLHPYALVGGKLYTKDGSGNRWQKVSSPGNLIANGKRGLPLTLFNRNFTSIAYRGVSESQTPDSIMDYVKKVEASKNAMVTFQGYQVPAVLFEHYSEWEISLILGGH